ncbi:hypothetical protein ACLESD_15120 [Pyxidicoccus sp. 3LFB2]
MQLLVPLAPLGMSVLFNFASNTPKQKWELLWSNELPFLALALCVPSALRIGTIMAAKQARGLTAEVLQGARVTLGTCAFLAVLALFAFYAHQVKAFGFEASKEARGFVVVAELVFVLLGLAAAFWVELTERTEHERGAPIQKS